MTPYGLQLVAAATPPEHEVEIIDEGVGQEVDFDKQFDLVGMSVTTAQAPRAIKLAKEFKKRGAKVVMGGFHPTLVPDQVPECFDAVCVGEGEGIWPEMVSDAEKGQLEGIYRSEEFIDLAQLPKPRRDLSPMDKYRFSDLVFASRGCPFKCNFCSVNQFYDFTYRTRPVEDVVAEVRRVKENRRRPRMPWDFVFFMDDNIVGSPEYAKKLFRALIPLKIRWFSQASITIADDPELLSLAQQSGCAGLAIGLESVREESLKGVNKHMIGTMKKYRENIKKIHDHKIFILGLFMFGLDSDDKDIFDEALKFCEENYVEVMAVAILTPFPGTEMGAKMVKEGRILTDNLTLYNQGHVVFQPKLMTPDELQWGFREVARKSTTVWSVFKRLLGARTSWILPIGWNIITRRASIRLAKDTSYL